jgi:hypothetical protein
MKLYATVTSERATKGQGGEWLDIEIFTTNQQDPTHKIEVREGAGQITISMKRKHFGKWYASKEVDTIYTNIKANKQKDEQYDPYVLDGTGDMQ